MADSQAPFDTAGEVFTSLQDERLISIYVANCANAIKIPASSLRAASPYFESLLNNGRFAAAKLATLRFPEDDLTAWKILAFWLVKGAIPVESDMVALVKAWTLGEKYEATEFQDHAMHGLFGSLRQFCRDRNEELVYEEALDYAPEGSAVRKWLVEMIMRYILLRMYPEEKYSNITGKQELLGDFMDAFMTIITGPPAYSWRHDSDEDGQPLWMRYMVGAGPTKAQDSYWHYDKDEGWVKTIKNQGDDH